MLTSAAADAPSFARLPLWVLLIVVSTTARLAETAVPFQTFDGSFDLLGQILTFTPDGKDSYSHCTEKIDRLPVSLFEATKLSLSDNDAATFEFPKEFVFPFFGKEYDEMHVSSNGYITFGTGDKAALSSTGEHFSNPRIVALGTQLELGNSAEITVKVLTKHVLAVTYHGVETSGGSNVVQILLHCDGKVQIYFQEVSLGSGQLISGLSDGGSPSGETDLSGCVSGSSKPSTLPPPSSPSPTMPAPSPTMAPTIPTTCSEAAIKDVCKQIAGCTWGKGPGGKKVCMEASTPKPTPKPTPSPAPLPTPSPTMPAPSPTMAPTVPTTCSEAAMKEVCKQIAGCTWGKGPGGGKVCMEAPTPAPTPAPTTPSPSPSPPPAPARPTTPPNSGNFYCGASNCNKRIESAWCNVNEGQCSKCTGQWCPEKPPTFFCGYQNCGKPAGKWCQFTQDVCEIACFGKWCPDDAP